MVQRLDLVQVVLRLSMCRSLEEITSVLRDSTRQLTGADGISIVLRDVDKCYYVEENAVGPLWKGKKFPMSACISGWCMIHREQVVIEDIYADDRIPHDAYRPTFVKSLAMTPIRSSNPVGAIGAYWATQRVATEEELRTLQALGDSAAMALENSQLIEALQETSRRKDAFLSMLAHELRNPLAPLRNGLNLLQLQGTNTEVVGETSEMMERQVGHLSRIVDDLLDVARINNGKVVLKRTKLDLVALLGQSIDDHRHAIDTAGLSLQVDVPGTPVWIEADATRITQVFTNIIHNARKYTPAGGRISISLLVDSATKNARIDVADTGIKIASAMLPRIFETFMQADTSLDRTAGGLGLGLAVAHGFVKLHEGSITVQSEGIGKGTRFTITLPNVLATTSQAGSAAASPASSGKQHILIIEDNRDSAHSLQKLMRVCGYETSIAYDGAEGVDMALLQHPDIVLCDIGLPKMDGYSVASTLRRSPAMDHMRLIAVTGYGTDEDRERTRNAGFDAHLVKPINLQELLGQLAKTEEPKPARQTVKV